MKMDSDSTKPLLRQHRASNEAPDHNFFDLELDFMVIPGYSKEKRFITIRSIAVSYIEKFTADERDAFVCYLAITFVDQFLSKNNEIPVIYSGQGCERNLELFAFCCVTLALRKCRRDLQITEFLNTHRAGEENDILVMELRILEGLQCRARPVTAITFIQFFFSLLMTKNQQHSSPFNLVPQLIVAIQKDMRFTEFRPSTLAASAILVTSYKLLYAKHLEFCQKILKSGCVKSEVKECFYELKNHGITDQLLNRVKHPRELKITYSWWSVVRVNKGKELLIEDSPAENITGLELDSEITEETEESDETVMYFDPSWRDPVKILVGEERYSPMKQILMCLSPICKCFGHSFGSGRLSEVNNSITSQ